MAVPVLLCGNGSYTRRISTTNDDVRRIQSAEMKFLRSVKKGCTRLDHMRNGEKR